MTVWGDRNWRKAADSNTLSAAGRVGEVKSDIFGRCSTKPMTTPYCAYPAPARRISLLMKSSFCTTSGESTKG